MSLTSPRSTEADILSRVGQIISTDDERQRGLWVFFLDRNDIQMPVVVPIDDVPAHPDLPLVGNVCWIVSRVLASMEPEGLAVIALSRLGTSEIAKVQWAAGTPSALCWCLRARHRDLFRLRLGHARRASWSLKRKPEPGRARASL